MVQIFILQYYVGSVLRTVCVLTVIHGFLIGCGHTGQLAVKPESLSDQTAAPQCLPVRQQRKTGL